MGGMSYDNKIVPDSGRKKGKKKSADANPYPLSVFLCWFLLKRGGRLLLGWRLFRFGRDGDRLFEEEGGGAGGGEGDRGRGAGGRGGER
jgi:hypothetical protein